MLAAHPSVHIDVADRVTFELRQEYGGKRFYIAKREVGDPRRRPWWKRVHGLVE